MSHRSKKRVRKLIVAGEDDQLASLIERSMEPSKDRLTQLQDYYVYDEHPYRFKDAPELRRDLAEGLKYHRLDKRYRFVWGGVVLVRTEPNGKTYEIARGSREACHEVKMDSDVSRLGFMTLMPKYLFVRARQARGVYYMDDLNQRVDVGVPTLVPPDKVAQIDYRYVDFGTLRWFIERRTTGQELVEAKVYDPKEEVPEHEWVTLMRLNTKKGRYYEPGPELLPVLLQREHEDENEDLNKVAAELQEQMAKSRQDVEEREDRQDKAEFDQLYEDVARRSVNPAYGIPLMPAPKNVLKVLNRTRSSCDYY